MANPAVPGVLILWTFSFYHLFLINISLIISFLNLHTSVNNIHPVKNRVIQRYGRNCKKKHEKSSVTVLTSHGAWTTLATTGLHALSWTTSYCYCFPTHRFIASTSIDRAKRGLYCSVDQNLSCVRVCECPSANKMRASERMIESRPNLVKNQLLHTSKQLLW